jgi:hypothetical protein
MPEVRCPCGAIYTQVWDLEGVASLGVALMGTCPRCDRRLSIGVLWQRRGELKPAIKLRHIPVKRNTK